MLLLLAPSLVSADIQEDVRVTPVLGSRRSGDDPSVLLSIPGSQHDQLVAYLEQHAQAVPRGGRPHPARTAAPRTAPPLRLVRRTTA